LVSLSEKLLSKVSDVYCDVSELLSGKSIRDSDTQKTNNGVTQKFNPRPKKLFFFSFKDHETLNHIDPVLTHSMHYS
jgi:hypothetical protein